MSEKLSRRNLLRWAAVGMGALAMAHCAPQATPTAMPTAPADEKEAESTAEVKPVAEGVTVSFWSGWWQFEKFWGDVQNLDEFKDLLGNHQVELKAGFDAEVLLAAVAGGTQPDVVTHPAGQYVDYYGRGVLLPLEDLVATSSIIKKDDFLEGNWENGFWEGVQYGIAAIDAFVGYGLYYNTKLVEEAGLDADNPPETWEDWLDWHTKLTEFDSAGNMVRMGLDPYDAMGGSLQFDNGFFATLSWDWDWFDEDNGTFDLANDKMAESFDLMGEFYRIAGPDNVVAMRQVPGQGSWGESITAEVQVAAIDGYFGPGYRWHENADVAKLGRATWPPVPASRKGALIQGTRGHYIMLFKDTKHPSEAFKITELVTTDAFCDIVFAQVGYLPARHSYLEKVDPSIYPGLDFFFQSVGEATSWTKPALCPITAYVQKQYEDLREAVYRDRMTGAEAAAEFQQRCEVEYEAAGYA